MTLDAELQPIDWETVENAVYDWLTGNITGSELEIVPEAIWANQNAPQPAYPFCSMSIVSMIQEGGRDESRATTDLARDAGEEVELLTVNQIQFTLSLSFHTDPKSGGTSPQGRARALAQKARSSLAMRAVLDFLAAAGIAVVAEEGVTDTSVVVNGAWLSRATLDVRMRVVSQMAQYAGFIEKVHLTSTDLGFDEIVDTSE